MRVGVVGGMGPAAGLHVASRIVAGTPAERDADHLEMVVWSVPNVPSRVEGFRGGASPLGALVDAVDGLERAACDVFVLACNGAHAWWDELTSRVSIPGLSMVDAAVDALAARGLARVGFVGSSATRESQVWARALVAADIVPVTCSPPEQAVVDRAIDRVKGGTLDRDLELDRIVGRLHSPAVVAACTELPLILPGLVDPADALAPRLLEMAA